jgi:hypothetical protein
MTKIIQFFRVEAVLNIMAIILFITEHNIVAYIMLVLSLAVCFTALMKCKTIERR